MRSRYCTMTRQVYALLGRKDEPTDAVEEYCRYLGAALGTHEIQLQIRRVPWEIHGWRGALHALRLQATNWRNTWVLVQYTALAWSARGFPQKFLRVLRILKSAGARVAVIFHDVEPFRSPRLIDGIRRRIQAHTMRRALTLADLAIFTVPLCKLSWLPFTPTNAANTDPAPSTNPSPLENRCHFIPVGPNLPIPGNISSPRAANDVPTVGVFSITGGEAGARETQTIIGATQAASQKIGKLRLLVFGRHAELREAALQEGLHGIPVELSVESVLSDQSVVERLCSCDVLLFLRGGISTRRSSAIAGISCGVPVIAYLGPETSSAFYDAGVILVSPSDPQELNKALLRTLSDPKLREALSRCNEIVYKEHFAWPAIAARFAKFLK